MVTKSKKKRTVVLATFTDQRKEPPKPTIKTASDETERTTYVLSIGKYNRRKIILVSHDAKKVANIYVDHLFPSYESPNIEIWRNEKRLGTFVEIEEDPSKVRIRLLDMSMGFN